MIRGTAAFAFSLVGALGLAPGSSWVQAFIEIPDRASCDVCASTVTRVRTLGTETGAGFMGEFNLVRMLGIGPADSVVAVDNAPRTSIGTR